jgi:HK97 family phage portal protein
MNTTLYSKELYGGGLRNAGVFSTDQKLDEDRLTKLQSQLGTMLNKARRGGKPVLLESGFKFSSVTITPEDAQFVSTKLLSIDQIATAFRVPPHMVGDSTRGTYSNNEQGNLEFYIHCLRPKLVELEEELNNKLFLDSEQGEYYIDITFEGIIRADTAARTAYYDKMFYIGAMCPNEIREKENLPAYEGGEKFYIPVNMSTNQHNNNESITAE